MLELLRFSVFVQKVLAYPNNMRDRKNVRKYSKIPKKNERIKIAKNIISMLFFRILESYEKMY